MPNEDMHWTDAIWWCQIVLVAWALIIAMVLSGCVVNPHPVEETCDEVFSPSAELEAYVARAAEEWHDAIGRNICVRPGGVPVVKVDFVRNANNEVIFQDGNVLCAGTLQEFNRDGSFSKNRDIQVGQMAYNDTKCLDLYRTIKHEIGHALARPDYKDNAHTVRGLMASFPNADIAIDADALELICKRSYCW